MTKTLADLKRSLSVGTMVTMTQCQFTHRNLNVPRYVVKVQTNGVEFAVGKDDKRGSFFDFPKASLLDFDGINFRIYTTGTRPLTLNEQHIIDTRPSNRPENQKQVEIDILSDGSSMYYADERHYKAHNAEYLRGHETIRGLRYDFNTGLVQDESLRGDALYTYTINQ